MNYQTPPPPPAGSYYPVPPQQTQRKGKGSAQPTWIGGIGGDLSLNTAPQKEKQTENRQKESKKKEKEAYYLPPSFVKADLLNGITAFTDAKGKRDPMRVVLRLSDLAVLPNDIKADLKGCL